MKGLHLVAFTLLVIGGLNWGLTALGWNVVNMVVGSWPALETLVYVLVTHKGNCRTCGSGGMM